MNFALSRYSLVSNENELRIIRERVQKNPKKPGTGGAQDFNALYKIVLIGESNTGKTSLLLRFSENIFSENYLCTIGVDFKTRTLRVDNSNLVKV